MEEGELASNMQPLNQFASNHNSNKSTSSIRAYSTPMQINTTLEKQ